jgi:hypothetical protein
MTKTFVLRIEEINYFSIKVEAETAEEAKEIASKDLNQFKSFDEKCDWRVTDYEEEN